MPLTNTINSRNPLEKNSGSANAVAFLNTENHFASFPILSDIFLDVELNENLLEINDKKIEQTIMTRFFQYDSVQV